MDDDLDILLLLEITLEEIGGFAVKTCDSALKALNLIQGGYRPDMVLMDMMMPKMDGITSLNKIRAMEGMEALPIIFLTAKVYPAEISHFKQKGATDVIIKPFEPRKLPEKLREIWSSLPSSIG